MSKIEDLLYTCDLDLLSQRKGLVTMLKGTENGLDDREADIRELLRQIAVLEMQKGKDEDEMLDQTLKAIEIVNIADIKTEQENLENSVNYLLGKKAELDKLEDELLRIKAKREEKRQNRNYED